MLAHYQNINNFSLLLFTNLRNLASWIKLKYWVLTFRKLKSVITIDTTCGSKNNLKDFFKRCITQELFKGEF